MTPDRMRGWMNKVPTGAKTVHLSVTTITGMQELATWERNQVEATRGQKDGDVADEIMRACLEYTAGETERQKFTIQWKTSRAKILTTTTHWVTPAPPEEAASGPSEAPGMSDATVIRELLTAVVASNKLIIGSLAPLGDTIKMLSARVNEAYQALDERRVDTSTDLVLPEIPPLTDQEIEALAQKSKAWAVLIDKGPEALDVGLAALSKWLLSSKDDDDETSNGSRPEVGETRVEEPQH